MKNRILIIDQKKDYGNKYVKEINEAGCELEITARLNEAFKYLQENPVEVIIIRDSYLPAPGSKNHNKLKSYSENSFLIIINTGEKSFHLSDYMMLSADHSLAREQVLDNPAGLCGLLEDINAFAPIKLLVITKSADIKKLIQESWSAERGEIEHEFETSVTESMERIVAGEFDLILIDSNFHGRVPALELLGLIKEDPEVDVPMLLIYEETEPAEIRNAFLAGVKDVILLDDLADGKIDIAELVLKSVKQYRKGRLLSDMRLTTTKNLKSDENAAETSGKANQNIFEHIFDNAVSAIFVLNEKGEILKYNDMAVELFGLKKNDNDVGKLLTKYFDPDDDGTEKLKKCFSGDCSKPVDIYTTGIHADMTVFPAELTISGFSDGGDAKYILFVRDITEKDKRENEVKQQNKELFLLYHISQEIRKEYELSNILYIILEQSLDFSQSDFGAIYLLDRDYLNLEATIKHAEREFEPEAKLKIKQADYTLQVRKNADIDSDGFRSSISLPIISREKIVGVLKAYSSKIEHFEGWRVRLLETLCNQIGIIIENAQLLKRIEARGQMLQELSDKLIKVQEDERKHLSQELHDGIGQSMSLIKIYLQMIMKSLVPRDDEKNRQFDNIIRLLDDTISAVRDMATRMHPMMLDDLGLVAAAKWYLNTYIKEHPIEINFKHPSVLPELDPDARLVIFRVLTEAVHNSLKYSNADRIDITLRKLKNKIALNIKDNGIGFDTEGIYNQSRLPGIGLLAMRERAASVEGICQILSSEGSGCEIKLEVPLGGK